MLVAGLVFANFSIFIGFFLLIQGLFGQGAQRDNIVIGSIWLLAVYLALAIVNIPVGIPFTSINFF